MKLLALAFILLVAVIDSYRFAAPGVTLLMNESISGTWYAGYSVARKLRSAYGGSAFRVRRPPTAQKLTLALAATRLTLRR